MQAQEKPVALPLRSHTILGACEAIGEDFGFNPLYLRVVLAASVMWNMKFAVAAYLALGAIVLASRLIFPKTKMTDPAAQPLVETPAVANEQREYAKAA